MLKENLFHNKFSEQHLIILGINNFNLSDDLQSQKYYNSLVLLNHNLETVPRLYKTVRRGANYECSLDLLCEAKKINSNIFTKSGIMVGLGEKKEEIYQVMDDLRAADVDSITIGQYLPPTPKHAKLERFVTPNEFDEYKKMAYAKGFLMVASSPLTRSSYHASDDFKIMQENRKNKLYSIQ